MIICHVTKLMMNLSQLSHLDLGSMLPGHRIKSYGSIESKFRSWFYVNDKFTMVFFHVIMFL
jgi:hypothetical protein